MTVLVSSKLGLALKLGCLNYRVGELKFHLLIDFVILFYLFSNE